MDNRSRAAIVEFAVILVWVMWAAAISWVWPVDPPRDLDLILEHFGALCLVAAAFVGGVAYARREPIGDTRLNRWDEAIGFYGIDCLAELAVLL